jgi:hypothetical protein
MRGPEMFCCCVSQGIADKMMEPQVWFPVLSAIIAYFLQLWIRTVNKRREDSAIASLYLYEIKKEVDIGIERLEHLYTHGGKAFAIGKYRPIMPTKNWIGVREIFPDDVFRRLNNVAISNGRYNEFKNLRFDLKNYYTVICKFGNDVINGKIGFEKEVARIDLDGARGVSKMLNKAGMLMDKNAKRFFWPY